MVGDPCETRMTDEAISRPADDRVRACSNALERRWRSRVPCVSDQRKGRAGLNYGLFRGTLRLNHCRITALLPIGLTPNDPMGSVARWAGPIFPSP